jgi:hypothetical protein
VTSLLRSWIPLVAAWAVGVLGLVSGDSDNLLRHVLVLAFVSFAPGMMAMHALDLRFGWPSTISLAIAVSLALAGGIAGIGVYAGIWEPRLFVYVIVSVSLALGLVGLFRRRDQRPWWRRLGWEPWRKSQLVEANTAIRNDDGSEPMPERAEAQELSEGRTMADETSEPEVGGLPDDVKELHRELARYQELVERLEAELATYRAGADARETFVPIRVPYARKLEQAGPDSDVIVEEAQARLSAALDRLKGRRTSSNPKPLDRAP